MGNGDWVGIRGADGYWIPMFHPSLYAGAPLSAGAFTATLVQGNTYNFADTTDDDRALQDPNPALARCPQAMYHHDEVHLRLDFTADFNGVLSIYVLGWDQVRDTVISINGADTTDTGAHQDGVWATWTISVLSGDSVHITAVPAFGFDNNAAFSAVFLDAVAGPVALHPGAIDSAESFGAPEVLLDHQYIDPAGIPSSAAFGVPLFPAAAQELDPAGIPSSTAFGRARVRNVGVQLQPSSIAPAEAFGEATVGVFATQYVALRAGWVDDEQVGTPDLELVGSTPLVMGGVDSTATVGTPILLLRGVDAPVPRNVLIDRTTREVYPWPVNHATEDSIRTLGRRLTRSGISASGRLIATRRVILLSQAAHPGPVHLMLHGSLIDRDQQQYTTFVRFFEGSEDRTFDYIDASGDSYHIAIVGFDARRANSPARLDGSYFTYSLEVEVLDVNAGALKGYAV